MMLATTTVQEKESDCRLSHNNRIELAVSITHCSPCVFVSVCVSETKIEQAKENLFIGAGQPISVI